MKWWRKNLQTCKTRVLFFILFFVLTVAHSQSTRPTVQSPKAPSITAPSITGPVAPTIQITIPTENATIVTTKTDSSPSETQAPSSLSTDLTATALETLNGLFTGEADEESLNALSSIGGVSSISDLSSLLSNQITSTEDIETQELLREILLKLSELEAKIDNLEQNTTK